MFYQDSKARKLISNLLLQIPPEYRGLRLRHPDMEVWWFTNKKTQDRDNVLTTVLDVLVMARVIYDDRVSAFNGKIILHPAEFSDIPRIRILLKPSSQSTV